MCIANYLVLQKLLPTSFFDFDFHFIAPTYSFYFDTHTKNLISLTCASAVSKRVEQLFL